MRGVVQPWHILILAVVLIVLFGWKKLPDMTRSFGRSARILRSEMDEMKNDRKSEGSDQTVRGEAPRTPDSAANGASSQDTVVPDGGARGPADRNPSA